MREYKLNLSEYLNIYLFWRKKLDFPPVSSVVRRHKAVVTHPATIHYLLTNYTLIHKEDFATNIMYKLIASFNVSIIKVNHRHDVTH